MVTADVVFAVPGNLDTPTGGYAYDRRVIAELRRHGCAVDIVDLGEGFPDPGRDGLAAAERMLLRVSRGAPVIVDGLALGVLPGAAAGLRRANPLIGLVHHPLALESGLSVSAAASLHASEREALSHARHVIVPSPATARALAGDFGVPADRITIAPPGTERAAHTATSADGPIRLLAVGSLVPRKGYDLLLDALASLRDLPWHLTIVGDARDPATARALAARIETAGLAPRVRLAGAVPEDRLAAFYESADVFVLASRHEGYGMAFAEAIAHGLPVIGTTAGAIPDTVPAAAGVLVPPDDVGALAAALARVLTDREARASLAAGARAAAAALPTWEQTAERFLAVIAKVSQPLPVDG